MDPTIDRPVGCASGGDLYFLVGAHRVRVDPNLWKLEVSLHDELAVPRTSPVQACMAAPLRVLWLRIFGPATRDVMTWISPILADGTHPDFKQIRDHFLPHESSCNRGPHWTWCGTPLSMKLVSPNNMGTNGYVSLKFDLDFYRTPTGGTFFVSSRGDRPLYLREWAVTYRWDDTLVIGYQTKPCTRPPKGQPPICTPLNYIETDRDVHGIVRSVLDVPASSDAQSNKSPAKAAPSSR